MATGVSKHERFGRDSLNAVSQDCNLLPLPEANASLQLSYEGKVTETAILTPPSLNFVHVDNQRNSEARHHLVEANSFVLSDNILALHGVLASRKKASLIYLDPPYRTGMEFHSRILEHAYNDNLAPVAYIEFMRRRLILARECLSEDGSIYIHIGHQMVAILKVLMDEIFGPKNFRNLIARRKCSSKNSTRKQYANLNDYILFYSKSDAYKWSQPGTEPETEWIEREYPRVDSTGRRYKLAPIHAPGTRHGETGKPWREKLPPEGKHWQYTPDKLDELDERGDIHWSRNDNPRRKVYLTKDKRIAMTDYWKDFRDAHHQSIKITGYPTEKNLEMMKMIVGASSEKGDLVIDPFCGSGTTLQAARDMNRQFIGMDTSFLAAKATLGRLRHGVQKMGDYVTERTRQKVVPLFEKESQNFTFVCDESVYCEYKQDIDSIAEI